jgi:hypothetical protein
MAPGAVSPLECHACEVLGEGRFGPILRMRRVSGDLVLRWLDRPTSLLPLVEIVG